MEKLKQIRKEKSGQKNELHVTMMQIVKEIWENELSSEFRYPVDKINFPDYYLLIEKAMDL